MWRRLTVTRLLAPAAKYPFDHLVIAAGAWSHRLSVQLGDWCPLETERGYNTTLPNPGVSPNRMARSPKITLLPHRCPRVCGLAGR